MSVAEQILEDDNVEERFDFANILFAGPCNRFCPWCIGKQVSAEASVNNLALFPPVNIEKFIAEINRLSIKHIVFTGTTTDPQLYRYEAELLALLRVHVTTGADYSLHTNGVLALRKMENFNLYDKVCISFPSFIPDTYQKLMGSRHVPDLARICQMTKVPIKISCILNEHNFDQTEAFLEQCHKLGIQRIVLRRLHGDDRNWNPFLFLRPIRWYRNNPVYDLDGMEVTYWQFDDSTSTSINLFSNGIIGTSYLLTETREFSETSAGKPPLLMI